jgi:hypothetical protein
MQGHIGGNDRTGLDNNPILQGVIVHQASPATPFIITNLDYNPTTGLSTITWNSSPGALYAVDFSTDMTIGMWIELDDGIPSQGEQTSFSDPDPRTAPRGFYRVRRF